MVKMTAIISTNVFVWVNVLWLDYTIFTPLMNSTFVIIIVPNVIFSWFLIQYTLMMISMETKFRAINRGIMRLSKHSGTFIELDRSGRMKDLQRMLNVHGILHDICCDIVDWYSFPVLLVITVSCGAIVATSYYLIVPFMVHVAEIPVLRIIDKLAYLVMQIYPIVTLTISITKLRREVKFASTAVQKLVAESFPNRHLQSQLEVFVLKHLHERLKFTCCGVFSLDCKLLHSIANMTVTYLVIIIQLHDNNKMP
ncbi:putative gustatory receptor 28a [Diachasmimorpha longicaudata]|uniref:putative gustatory receptor 28a n=1 Tax=Diachasmimorpha longicaudata TaxID=58733 RepID=UPI0030B8C24E